MTKHIDFFDDFDTPNISLHVHATKVNCTSDGNLISFQL